MDADFEKKKRKPPHPMKTYYPHPLPLPLSATLHFLWRTFRDRDSTRERGDATNNAMLRKQSFAATTIKQSGEGEECESEGIVTW